MGYVWKRLEVYFQCVLWFFFIIIVLNFNALCDVHTLLTQYTVLLKSNRILCLLIGIIFKCFLMFSYKFEEHFWFFLNHASIYEEAYKRCSG